MGETRPFSSTLTTPEKQTHFFINMFMRVDVYEVLTRLALNSSLYLELAQPGIIQVQCFAVFYSDTPTVISTNN